MARQREAKKPLPAVKCGDSKCEEGLHVYRAKRKKKDADYEGIPCRECGDDSVNWEEFRKRDLTDVSLTIQGLKKEYICNVFWNLEIDKGLERELIVRGRRQLEKDVETRLIKVVKKCGKDLFRDGTQTPLDEHNIIFFAQHATGTCCRKCIKIWHNIPYDKELDLNDLNYIKGLIMNYINYKLPNLPDAYQAFLFQ